jgi:putative membrane protein
MKASFSKWVVVGCALAVGPAFAQGTQQPTPGRGQAPDQGRMQQPGQMQQGQMQQPAQRGQQAQRPGIPLPKDAQGFVTRMHQNSKREIELGQMAQQKTQNPQVRELAQNLVQEHQSQDQQLQQMARTQKWKLGEVRPMDDAERKLQAANKAEKEKLQALEGEAFDRAFLAHMVADHDHAIILSQQAMQQAQDPQLQQLLQQSTPMLMQHRQQAYQLLGQLQPQPQLGVGGGGLQGEPMHDPARRPTPNQRK